MGAFGSILGKVGGTVIGNLIAPGIGGAIGGTLGSVIGGSVGGKKGGSGGNQVGGNSGLVPFDAGGLSLRYQPGYGTVKVTSNDARTNLVNNQSASFLNQASGIRSGIQPVNAAYTSNINDITAQLGRVAPGFGDLTKARVNTIQNAGRASASDLRSNLAKRRVLGSSFADDAMTRNQMDFAQQEEAARAQSFLEEMDLQNQLSTQRLNQQVAQIQTTQAMAIDAFTADRAADQVKMEELDKQLSVVTGMLQSAQQIAQSNAQNEAQARQQEAQSKGGLMSSIGDKLGGFLSDKIGSYFGGSGGSGGGGGGGGGSFAYGQGSGGFTSTSSGETINWR